MDAAFLSNQHTSERRYKHFTVSSQPEKADGSAGKVEFFYMGKDTHKINFLIQTFCCGYAAENAEKAISILTRIADSSTIPDIIIVDHAVGEQSFQALNGYISHNKRYAKLPFLLDASGLTPNELDKYRCLHLFDEIIFLDDKNEQKLISKVRFLKNVKSLSAVNTGSAISQKTLFNTIEPRFLLKRIVDIVIALLVIFVCSPVFLLIALAIKLESKGPVMYVSKRAGKGYRIFNFFKFRTMIIDADKRVEQLSHLNHYSDHDENGQVFFKVVNDSRITKVGAFLRRTSMDELPQFFNVLSGSMSLVGNRPLPLYEAAKLTTDHWAERFTAPAGITGLWQIKKREKHNMSMEERINLDIAYSKKYNFLYDLWIMANTQL